MTSSVIHNLLGNSGRFLFLNLVVCVLVACALRSVIVIVFTDQITRSRNLSGRKSEKIFPVFLFLLSPCFLSVSAK